MGKRRGLDCSRNINEFPVNRVRVGRCWFRVNYAVFGGLGCKIKAFYMSRLSARHILLLEAHTHTHTHTHTLTLAV